MCPLHTELVILFLKGVWGSGRLNQIPKLPWLLSDGTTHENEGWSVWLHSSTVSCCGESMWESRPGRNRKTLYGNPQSEWLHFCRIVCKLHKRIHRLSSQGASLAANLAFNFSSISTVPNSYLFWLFSFPYWHRFLHQTYPLAKEALWLNPKQNTKQRPLSQERLRGRSLRGWVTSTGSISREGQGVDIGIRSSPIRLSYASFQVCLNFEIRSVRM